MNRRALLAAAAAAAVPLPPIAASHPDARLLELARLVVEADASVNEPGIGEDEAARRDRLSIALEKEMIATPAATLAGFMVKLRRYGAYQAAMGASDFLDDRLWASLAADAERIAA